MANTKRIRVVVVDDHMIVREGLSTLLEAFADMQLAGEAASGEEAVQLCAKVRPQVVLMDLIMPGMGGISAIRAIRKNQPETQVLVLTSFKEKEYVRGALEAGAIGYLLKNLSAAELAQAIRMASVGDPTVAAEATRALIDAVTQPLVPGSDLTVREQEVLSLIVQGLSNTQIALQLELSPSTIKNHISRIFSKLGVATRTEAATLALRHKMVS
jgi:two-component system, NarL family, response regulator LiaR